MILPSVAGLVHVLRVVKSLQMVGQLVGKLEPDCIGNSGHHFFVGFKINLLSGGVFQHPFDFQPLVDCPARDVYVLRMEDDEVGLLLDGEEELLDALHPEGCQVGSQLNVVAHGLYEIGQPDIVPREGLSIGCNQIAGCFIIIVIDVQGLDEITVHGWTLVSKVKGSNKCDRQGAQEHHAEHEDGKGDRRAFGAGCNMPSTVAIPDIAVVESVSALTCKRKRKEVG